MIEDLNNKIMTSGGVISDEDKFQFLDMKEQYEATNKAIIYNGNIYNLI
jgi:hypothetical protein